MPPRAEAASDAAPGTPGSIGWGTTAQHPYHWATPKGAGAIAGAIAGGPAPRSTLLAEKFRLPGGSLNAGRVVYADRISD